MKVKIKKMILDTFLFILGTIFSSLTLLFLWLFITHGVHSDWKNALLEISLVLASGLLVLVLFESIFILEPPAWLVLDAGQVVETIEVEPRIRGVAVRLLFFPFGPNAQTATVWFRRKINPKGGTRYLFTGKGLKAVAELSRA